MSTAIHHPAVALGGTAVVGSGCAVRDRVVAERAGLVRVACGVGILAVALLLRGYNISAVYQSADQATMDYFVRHNFGIRWIFEHSYGPVSPLIHRSWAEVCWRVGIPITEATARLPSLLIGLAQVAITFPLLRRLGSNTNQALAGMLGAALLSTCITDARQMWAWGYLSLWLLTGTVALWASLAFLQDRRGWQLAIGGGSLLLHCLSNVYAFALPATLLAIWAVAIRDGLRLTSPTRKKNLCFAAIGFALPCLAALVTIAGCWMWTSRGQLGHLLVKKQMGTAGLHWDQLVQLPAMWCSQFGYLFGVVAAAGLLLGGFILVGRQRWLVLWAWLSLLPVLLAADWDCIGYARAYFIEPVYPSAIVGLLVVAQLAGRMADRPEWRRALLVLTGAAVLHMGIGVGDDMLGGGRLRRFTGLVNNSNEFRHDIGAKAAGWYVRAHVPDDAVIMSVHTNKGMEVAVAELYLGRKVLAGWDHKPAMLQPLINAMAADADVVVVDLTYSDTDEALADFERVCTFSDHGKNVRRVYARQGLHLPKFERDVSEVNRWYDQAYQPRRVPIPLPATERFSECLSKYQQAEKELRNQCRRGAQLAAGENH